MTCYTVITNGYDNLTPPRVISDGWEYVVFSDRFIDVPPWQCVITDKHNRDIKIRGHLYLYFNLTLYVDASITIKGDLNKLIVPDRYAAFIHPHRKSIEEEAEAVIRIKGCDHSVVWDQVSRYRKSGYKADELAQCGVLLRDFSDPVVRRINNTWYDEWSNSCGRDQMSFLYSCWRNNHKPILLSRSIFNKFFILNNHK